VLVPRTEESQSHLRLMSTNHPWFQKVARVVGVVVAHLRLTQRP
jgi:hypothetical protein